MSVLISHVGTLAEAITAFTTKFDASNESSWMSAQFVFSRFPINALIVEILSIENHFRYESLQHVTGR